MPLAKHCEPDPDPNVCTHDQVVHDQIIPPSRITHKVWLRYKINRQTIHTQTVVHYLVPQVSRACSIIILFITHYACICCREVKVRGISVPYWVTASHVIYCVEDATPCSKHNTSKGYIWSSNPANQPHQSVQHDRFMAGHKPRATSTAATT